MTRFAWAQFRLQGLIAATGLAVVAAVLAATGPGLAHLYGTTVVTCQARDDCQAVTSTFLLNDRALQIVLRFLVVVIPGVLGVFWGAPLIARELETGTFRFAWTQGITRTRWMAVKLSVAGLASMAVTGLLSLMVTWWSSPLDTVGMNPFGTFDERGLVPVGYAAFAFVLGITAGVLIGRTLPAMAVTLAIFAAVRGAISKWVRPNLMAPLHAIAPDNQLTGNGNQAAGAGVLDPRDWILSNQTVNGAGRVIGQNGLIGSSGSNISVGPKGVAIQGLGSCPSLKMPMHRLQPAQAQATMNALVNKCVAHLRVRDLISYQPASHYWPMQWYELAIYLGLAIIVAGTATWWVRSRLT